VKVGRSAPIVFQRPSTIRSEDEALGVEIELVVELA
jgi:hypothetical protein